MKTIVLRRAPDPQQFTLQRLARLGVERGERLVHQQHLGIIGEASRDRDTLLHAAGELMRIAVGKAGQPDQVEEMPRDVAPLLGLEPGDIETELDILFGGTPGKQRILLEHDAAVATGSCNRPAIEQNPTAGRQREPAQQIEQGGFPAAAWANQGEEFAGANIERDVFQSGEVAAWSAALAAHDKLLADMLEADFHSGHWASAVFPGRK
ncbi:hypothetical protein ABIB68_006587 [Bradyrhizobium sp. F1.2.2]